MQSCKWWKPLGQCRPVPRCGLQQPGQQGAGRAIGKESPPRWPRTLRQGLKPAGESVGCKADPHFPLPVIRWCSLQLAAPALPSPSLSLLVAFPSLDLASSQLLALYPHQTYRVFGLLVVTVCWASVSPTSRKGKRAGDTLGTSGEVAIGCPHWQKRWSQVSALKLIPSLRGIRG